MRIKAGTVLQFTDGEKGKMRIDTVQNFVRLCKGGSGRVEGYTQLLGECLDGVHKGEQFFMSMSTLVAYINVGDIEVVS